MSVRCVIIGDFLSELRSVISHFYRAARRRSDFQTKRDSRIDRDLARSNSNGLGSFLNGLIALRDYIVRVLKDGIFYQGITRRTQFNALNRRLANEAYRAHDQTMDFRATIASTSTRASIFAASGDVSRLSNGAIVTVCRLAIGGSATACANTGDCRSGIFRATDHAMDRFASANDVNIIYRDNESARTLFGRNDREGCALPKGIQNGLGDATMVISIEDASASAFCLICSAINGGRQRRVLTGFICMVVSILVDSNFSKATYGGDSTYICGAGSNIYSTCIGTRCVKLFRI